MDLVRSVNAVVIMPNAKDGQKYIWSVLQIAATPEINRVSVMRSALFLSRPRNTPFERSSDIAIDIIIAQKDQAPGLSLE
jgi:hypothetical protein